MPTHRSLRYLLFCVLLPVGCSYQQRWNSTCDISFSLICTKRVECGQHFDQALCEAEIREELICDPGADLEALQACRRAASDATCAETVPAVCLEAMCDALVGCQETNLKPCPEPGMTQTADGGFCEPVSEE